MIGRTGSCTLQELHFSTGLPRPSILRLLESLIALGYVRKGLSDGRYRVTSQVLRLAESLTLDAQVVEIAVLSLDKLCDTLRCPSDLALFDSQARDCMQIAETSLRQSRFYISRGASGTRVNILGSAVGLAFLSSQPDQVVKSIVSDARRGRDPNNLSIIASGTFAETLLRAKSNEYAVRSPLFRGGAYNSAEEDDGLEALAIPLMLEGAPGAAINITWKRKARSMQDMIEIALPELRAAAEVIRARWSQTAKLVTPRQGSSQADRLN